MFEEGQHEGPIIDRGDPVYRERRLAVAAAASRWSPGEPAPVVAYTAEEDEVWRAVCDDLRGKHRAYACREFLDGKEALGLPVDRVPQLEDVSDALEPLTGFRYRPAAGIVPPGDFYGALADREFWATQYVRHPAVPLYTPEPDVIHEVAGHGNTLADHRFTALYEAAGAASRRVETPEALSFVSRVFWFTLEFGVVHEDDGLKAYGAGILSSPGEIEEFRDMTIRPLDVVAMGTQDYDISQYQDVLFAARSFSEVQDVVGGFWSTCDDDSIARLR